MSFLELLAKRHSTREYNQIPVPDEQIEQLLIAANASPIGRGLYQNVHLSVIQNKSLLKEITSIASEAFGDPSMDPFYGASTIIVASCIKEAATTVGLANSACMVENMHLAATELGLGSVYLYGFIHTIAKDEALIHRMGVPADFVPVAALAVGNTDLQVPDRVLTVSKIATDFIR